ncbi:MAG: hypothetical protein LBG60_10495 [Bifidobacteriaceae bacterium]|nr:hypothetical protein [Bifidobacteriaceae bacterium]
MVERFAPNERDYIFGADADAALGGAAAHAGPPWQVLPPGVGARAVEVWAKKQAWMVWKGAWPSGGLAGFSVVDGSELGVRFWPVAFAEAHGLVGWVCAGDGAARGVEAVWVGEVARR